MENFRRKAGTFILLALGLTAPAIGSAATPSHFEDVSVRVSFADLNIHSQAGAKVLYARLKRASEEVCGLDFYTINRSLTQKRIARACYLAALEASVEKVDSDALSEMHDG
mgnify:CR=1 FL=1